MPPRPEPGLYPRSGPRATSSAAERKVYDALRKHLPEGWYAWHSLSVFTSGHGEAEADFVIADPRRGMLVLTCEGRTPVTVPLHGTLDRGTLRSILRAVDVSVDDFQTLLRK